MDIIAGIDGGGTKTILMVESLDGTDTQTFRYGAFNLNSIGEQRFIELLAEIFLQIQECGNCVALCIGAAGISNPRLQELIESSVEHYLKDTKVVLLGDHEIALYGAMNGQLGVILIAGTGSICTGMDRNGKMIRVGGYGHLIDDFGSGYSIGKDGLAAIVRAEDGRGLETSLWAMIMEEWQISTIYELIKKIYETSDKSRIASISRVVELAAREGDKVALEIMEKNAGDLLELIQVAYQSISPGEKEVPLSLMGGMLENETTLRDMVIKQVSAQCSKIKIIEARSNAAEGALLYAKNRICTCE